MRYTRTFTFKKTEEEAKAFCKEWDAKLTPYARKRYPSHYTPWETTIYTKGEATEIKIEYVCWVVE